MKTLEQQTLSIILYDLKSSFTKIIHELNERWERATKIKDFFERIKEYSNIFKIQNRVIDLMREAIKAIREARCNSREKRNG